MTKEKIEKTTDKIKKLASYSKETTELIIETKKALIEAKKLVEQVKGLVKESDFPELKDIKIPKIKMPLYKNPSHELINYQHSLVNWDKLSVGLKKYIQIMDDLYSTDVSVDRPFQKRFNGFYRIRQRPKEFYASLYQYLESNKNSHVSFEKILRHFFNEFDRIEPSFSSKIAATINPNLPIWDSIILKHLKITNTGYKLQNVDKIGLFIGLYNSISKFYTDFLKQPLAKKMISDFNSHFPDANISEIKKIDFILWQSRTII